MKKVRGEAGVYEITVRLQGIASVPLSANMHIETSVFHDRRGVLPEFSIAAVDITVQTSGTDLRAAVP
jgi:hypothetical protein